MSTRLLVSFRSLTLSVPRRSSARSLATVSDPPTASTSATSSSQDAPSSETTDGAHQWQTRPPRKPTAKQRAIPGRVHIEAETPEGHLRPHLGIEVNENHGLYGFFRRVKDDVTGVSRYETVEPIHKVNDYSGRAWLASELRGKSFKDLHTLWYVLARERNLLATQSHEARRNRINTNVFMNTFKKDMRCRKSMARIKQVLNERRLAYDQAVQLYKDGVTVEQLEAAEAQAANDAPATPTSSMLEEEPVAEAAKESTETKTTYIALKRLCTYQ